MKVELRRHVGKCVLTGVDVDTGKYGIWVDDLRVGWLHDPSPKVPNPVPMLYRRMGPLEAKEIEHQIRVKMHPRPISPLIQIDSNVPLIKPKEQASFDDFN